MVAHGGVERGLKSLRQRSCARRRARDVLERAAGRDPDLLRAAVLGAATIASAQAADHRDPGPRRRYRRGRGAQDVVLDQRDQLDNRALASRTVSSSSRRRPPATASRFVRGTLARSAAT